MLQINQASESLSRSFVNTSLSNVLIDRFIRLELENLSDSGQKIHKSIMIFAGYEYKISFYDNESGRTMEIIGLVDSIHGDNRNPGMIYFTMKYINKVQPRAGSMSINPAGMPSCGCVLNPVPDGKYDECKLINVVVSNIIMADYIVNQSVTPLPNPPPQPRV